MFRDIYICKSNLYYVYNYFFAKKYYVLRALWRKNLRSPKCKGSAQAITDRNDLKRISILIGEGMMTS